MQKCPASWHRFFKAISDTQRQQILDLVAKNPGLNATQIRTKVKLSQPTISHHLKLLTQANLITSRKEGKEVFYQINQKSIKSCCMGFCDRYSS